MKIQKILEQQQKFLQKSALDKNLGDGFLIAKNKIYSRIRAQALQLGFQYDKEPNLAYWALPLSQLEVLLSEKKIPYIDNVSVLEQIEKKIPSLSLWDDVTDNLKRNHIFHESCHALARSVSKKYFKPQQDPRMNKAAEETVLQLMIEESFANTCELVGIIDVEDAFHKLFYEINSYIFMYEDRVHLKNFFNDFGKNKAFVFILLSYLHANFIRPRFEDKDLDSVLHVIVENPTEFSTIRNDAKKMKTLRAISRICFELNPRFRMVTSVFYLKLLGMNYSKEEIHKMDFMNHLVKNPSYLKFIQELMNLVIN